MSSRIIPKERLSAYQRWEMDAFERAAPEPEPEPEPVVQPNAVILPTAEQIERIHQQAHQEGFEAGYQEGRQQAEAEAGRLRELASGFSQALHDADQTICQELLGLALELARQMLRETLRVKPERVLAVVRESIRDRTAFSGPAQLFLNPEDAALVREHLEEELNGWTIRTDPRLERGGCRVETAGSQIDATLATRWQRIAQALGQDHRWLE